MNQKKTETQNAATSGSTALGADVTAPEWITRIQRDYSRTGFYRPSDLKRVLGDPRNGVFLEPNADELALTCRLIKSV
jgi:hypothetical protein